MNEMYNGNINEMYNGNMNEIYNSNNINEIKRKSLANQT